ncbi:MAG: hypothetical protein ACFFD4_37865, partial [Candidatus Odinarchaeota archaeon]
MTIPDDMFLYKIPTNITLANKYCETCKNENVFRLNTDHEYTATCLTCHDVEIVNQQEKIGEVTREIAAKESELTRLMSSYDLNTFLHHTYTFQAYVADKLRNENASTPFSLVL